MKKRSGLNSGNQLLIGVFVWFLSWVSIMLLVSYQYQTKQITTHKLEYVPRGSLELNTLEDLGNVTVKRYLYDFSQEEKPGETTYLVTSSKNNDVIDLDYYRIFPGMLTHLHLEMEAPSPAAKILFLRVGDFVPEKYSLNGGVLEVERSFELDNLCFFLLAILSVVVTWVWVKIEKFLFYN